MEFNEKVMRCFFDGALVCLQRRAKILSLQIKFKTIRMAVQEAPRQDRDYRAVRRS